MQCAIDFSDLKSKVEKTLNNWSAWQERVIKIRERLLYYRKPEAIVKHVKGVFDRCLKRVP